ncbi:MAG: UDP-2,3-diacylglucosamine diphosphatase [Pseudomonadota bacterium]|nr:UDP-2,3-diacylglucosamine diphosphatase [Pseudomonadota bacterium]
MPRSSHFASFVAPEAWRAIDFISDLHLAATTPRAFDSCAAHLMHTDADAVFILGDLFDAWIGDDMAKRGFEQKGVDLLKQAAGRRCIAFMAGNRDFLLGDGILRQSGVMRLADPTLVAAFGTRTLLTHGDALCLGDTSYQRFRRVVRHPAVQRTFLSLPLRWRAALGQAARRRSRGGQGQSPRVASTVDLDRASMLEWLRVSSAPALVHGHTHAPASHVLAAGSVRHVLSDWDLDGPGPPRAEVLRWSAGGFARIAPSTATVGIDAA